MFTHELMDSVHSRGGGHRHLHGAVPFTRRKEPKRLLAVSRSRQELPDGNFWPPAESAPAQPPGPPVLFAPGGKPVPVGGGKRCLQEPRKIAGIVDRSGRRSPRRLSGCDQISPAQFVPVEV